MAMESACKMRVGRDRYEGRVRMDGGFIDFAGSTKFRFRLAEIRNPRREGGTILFDFHGHSVTINLGARAAGRWIDYILHPQSLADRLGVRDGHSVRILNLDDPHLVDSVASKNARVVGGSECDLLMMGVEHSSELRQLGDLSERLRPGGAIWVVLPKSVRTVTKANVTAAAREAGLDHVKVVDYSETQAAYKIVRPDRTARKANGGNGTGLVAADAPTTTRTATKRRPVRASAAAK